MYYTASGIITPVGGRPVHRLREDWLECQLREDCAQVGRGLVGMPIERGLCTGWERTGWNAN